MKRSNRLILLIGVFLAIVTFVGIVLILGSGNRGPAGTPTTPTELPTVFADRDIPLGTIVTAEMLRTENRAVTSRDTTAFGDESLLLGKIVRTNVVKDKQLTAEDFNVTGAPVTIDCPPGQRCIALQVDQVSGVGTLVRTGDYVDLLVAFTGDKFPIITLDPENDSFTVVAGVNPTSSKLLLQGIQAVGTLLPPPPAQAEGQTGDPGTTLNGQQEIIILSVDAQQAEVIKFAQLDGSISVVLRSPQDFRDPNTQEAIVPPPTETTGITLRVIVDEYEVLVPQLVEAVLPNQETP